MIEYVEYLMVAGLLSIFVGAGITLHLHDKKVKRERSKMILRRAA